MDTPPLIDQLNRLFAEAAHEDVLVPLSGHTTDAHTGLLLLIAAIIAMGITFGKQLYERSRDVYFSTPVAIALFVFLVGALMVAGEARPVGLTAYFEYGLRLIISSAIFVAGATFVSLYSIRYLARVYHGMRNIKEALHTKLVQRYGFPETANEFAEAVMKRLDFLVKKIELFRKKKMAV